MQGSLHTVDLDGATGLSESMGKQVQIIEGIERDLERAFTRVILK